MDLPRVRGALLTSRRGHAVLTVCCPECGAVHRHDEGPVADPEVQARLARGFVEAWMPCRGDLPGNVSRIVLPPRAGAAARATERSAGYGSGRLKR